VVTGRFLLSALLVSSSSLAEVEDEIQFEQTPHSPEEDMSLNEINRQLENPLTSLWSLTFENSYTRKSGDLIGGTTPGNVFFFQPGLPIPFGDDMTFINRPAIPIVTGPVLDARAPDGISKTSTGLGDIQMLSLVGPDKSQGFVWGLGGTFKFPTATSDSLGSGKWQAGPAAMAFYFAKPWTVGLLAEHWWSYAGDGHRAHTNQTDIKYIVRYGLGNATSIGFGPTISIDWTADTDNRYTVPIGLGISKTLRWGETPVKIRLEAHYNVIKPDDFGDDFKILFRIAPVIKSPFGR